jgi:signal transduction histidine kinase
MNLGPVALLAFLVIVCALVVRHRFLDVDVFIVRALFVAGTAAIAALVLATVSRRTAGGFLPMFAVIVALTLLVSPIWRIAMGAGASTQHPVLRALMEISRNLPAAQRAADVWGILDAGLTSLQDKVEVTVYTLDPAQISYSPVLRVGAGALRESSIRASAALPRMLIGEAAPITRIYLNELVGDTGHARRSLAEEVLAAPECRSAELIVPLLRNRALVGWIAAGGGRPETYVRPEVSAALLAVAYQTVASLERLEALEASRRREALAVVGEMAAGLAHEIRNPLAAIHGAAQVITEDPRGPRSAEMLDVIRQESERLGCVVGDFLDYARPGSQRREPLDLADLAGRALRAAEAAGTGLRATVHAPAEVPRAEGDPDQILRAFANLIRNAREAAGPDGSLDIDVSRDGLERVAIRFRDNGPGIAPEHLPRLFQPFFTTKEGGHGLGLALVDRVAQAHDGEVRVDSRPGSGAAFTLILKAHARHGATTRPG